FGNQAQKNKWNAHGEKMNNKNNRLNSINLRRKAEKKLKDRSKENTGVNSEADNLKLIHELEVHQIELEMQNEELALARSEAAASSEKYTELYDFAPIGYFTLSPDGEILELNLSGAKMIGKERSQLKESRVQFFISDDTKSTFNLFLESIFKNTGIETCEITLLNSDNLLIPVYITGTAPENGEYCLITMTDISERRKMEEGLQKIQKLESLGVLAGGIAHNFNNLLCGIFGYIDMAYESSNKKEVKNYLFEVLNSIDRARGLTQQLLTFSKGGAPVKRTEPMLPFLKETVQFALSGSNVSCNFDLPTDLWSCNFDKNQIQQVVDNIVINAQQSMLNGGTIWFSAQNIHLSENEHPSLPQGRYIKISIRDMGVGIPKEIQPRIFDPYFTTKTTGNGLGLSTSFSIINRHDGSIDIESETGKGTVLNIYLPAFKKHTTPVKKTDHSTSPSKYKGNGLILIMDDEDMILKITTEMLAVMGHEVICKSNGKDAVDFFREKKKKGRRVVAMIFDLTVPGGMGGKDAVKEIRKFDPDIPVFVASDYSEDPVMSNPTAYGFTASISKPFRLAELADMLEKNLPRRQEQS
ncbi:MAG: ATP-binding protein, partial [bacterium]